MAMKKPKAKSKTKKGRPSKPSTGSESTVPDNHVDNVDDTKDAERVSLWKKRWDDSFRTYHGKACVMDGDLVREASREDAADVRSDFDRLNFVGCTQPQIDALFPLVPGRGTAHPPCTTLLSGAPIREWRNASDAAQRDVRHSYESRLKVYVAYVSGRIDNEEFARALVSLNPTTTSSDSRASCDSPLGGQEDEPELQRVSESHAPVKGSNKDDDGNIGLVGCSGRLSASTAATEAETIASNDPCSLAQLLPRVSAARLTVRPAAGSCGGMHRPET
jgi:hypothetical protein